MQCSKKILFFQKKFVLKVFPVIQNFFRFKPLIKIDLIQNQKKKFPRDCREFNSQKNDVFEILKKFILSKL